MSKDYGQFCGLAQATQVLGERWALMIVRDLSVGARRFKQLHDGLPGVPTTVLTTRLRELEQAGIVEREVPAPPNRGFRYALTPYGHELTPVLDALGRWGAKRMSAPSPDDVITDSSLAAALRTGFQPGKTTATVTYLIHAGPATAWATTAGDTITVGTGVPATAPDLTIHSGPQMRQLLAGKLSPADALATGAFQLEGPRRIFDAFARTFHVPLDVLATEKGHTRETQH